MKSAKRLIDHPIPAAAADVETGSRQSRRPRSHGVLMGSLLCVVVLWAGASGCCAIGRPTPWSKQANSTSARRGKPEASKSIFSSWFRAEEPSPPPQSPKEWLALEPLRP